MLDYKTHFLQNLFIQYKDKDIKVLDMGSGTSKDWVDILKMFPNISYYGVEFNKVSMETAGNLLSFSDSVTLVNEFGEGIQEKYRNFFDVVISLSVLEHVKYLDAFLLSSTRILKTGGVMIHRYDLGHSLHSESYSERCKVFLCRNFPWIISSKHFTTHPNKSFIIEFLKKNGMELEKIEQHQIPNLKKISNLIKKDVSNNILMHKLIALDTDLYNALSVTLPEGELDYYFPAITLKFRKI